MFQAPDDRLFLLVRPKGNVLEHTVLLPRVCLRMTWLRRGQSHWKRPGVLPLGGRYLKVTLPHAKDSAKTKALIRRRPAR